ncbi:MAG: hypothetical protein LBK92_02300 [Endomicrobium sp.]|jgi:hypothetical protein|nr:hypothetical protein [Endomicrobium sp.]
MKKIKWTNRDYLSKEGESPVIYCDESGVKMCKSIEDYKMMKKLKDIYRERKSLVEKEEKALRD